MSKVTINYSSLEDAVEYSRKARKAMKNYGDKTRNIVITPISKLEGDDSKGYAKTASDLAGKKINALNTTTEHLIKFENSVTEIVSTAKSIDTTVAANIKTLADNEIPTRAWYQIPGDWIYNTFCVDLSNHFSLVRDFCDAMKVAGTTVGKGIEIVHNWFKYGDGKYIWKMTKAVVASVVAVGGAIAAVCAIPFTGGMSIPLVIAFVGAVATSIGAVITIINSAATIHSNGKALALSGNVFKDDDGQPGAARYYGTAEKLSDVWEKTDLGDAGTNSAYAYWGKKIDTTKKVADTTAFICNIASLGNVKDFRITAKNNNINMRYNEGKRYKGYSFTPQNIKRNIAHDMGYYASEKGKLKEGSFKLNLLSKDKQFKYTLTTNKNTYMLPEKLVKFFNIAKTADNSMTLAESVDGVYDYVTSSKKDVSNTSAALEKITGIFKTSKWLSTPDKYITKSIKTIGGWVPGN